MDKAKSPSPRRKAAPATPKKATSPAKAPKKPGRKKQSVVAETGKTVIPATVPEKSKHAMKMTPPAVQAIVDLTLAGWTGEMIIGYLTETFGITITMQMIHYYRRQNREKLLATIEQDIAAMRAQYPEGALPVGRMGMLVKAAEAEFKKQKISGYNIAALVGAMDTMDYRQQSLRHKLREFEKRYPERKEGEGERILRELERRSHVMRNVTEEAKRMESLAGGDFASDTIETEAVVLEEGPAEAAGAPEGQAPAESPEPGPGKGLGEDALLG